MEQALRSKLLETAALAKLVGREVNWGLLTPGARLPGLSLFEVSGVPGITYSGPDGWMRSRVQVDAWGGTYREAWEVAEVLGGRAGLFVRLRETVAGVRLRTFVLNRRASTETDGPDVRHRHSLDVLVWHARLDP